MYTRINFPQGEGGHPDSDLDQIQYEGLVQVPVTIPVDTPVYIYMPCEFKLGAWATHQFTIKSTGKLYVRFFFSANKGTGTTTIIKSTSTSSSYEIPQNTSIQVQIYSSISSHYSSEKFSRSDYIRWLSNAYMFFGTFTPVVKGDLIKSTDFTAVNQTATIGEKITNSNFTSNTIITADEWNNKWKIE